MSTNRLLSGSALRLIALLAGMAISLYMMPFLVTNLGDHNYGLWVLVASTLGFYGVLDLGLSSATQRFISHALARDDKPEMNSVLSNSLALFGCIGCLAALITTVLAIIAPLFFDAPDDANTFRNVVLLMGFSLALNFVMNAYNGVLVAYYRFDVQAKVTLFKNIVRAATIVLIFQYDATVMNLALITVLYELIGHWVILRSTLKQAPWIAPTTGLVSRGQIKKLTGFGWFSFLVFFGIQIRNKGPHFIVASTLSIASVTVFQIASQLISYLNQIQESIFGVLTPYFTKVYGQNIIKKLNSHYLLSLKLAGTSSSILAGSMIILGQSFIKTWMGPAYNDAYLTLVPIAIGTYFAAIHIPSFQLLQAMAKHRYYSYFGIVEGVLILAIGIWTTSTHGILGIGYTIGIILCLSRLLIMPVMVSKIAGIPWGKVMGAGVRVTLVTCSIQSTLWALLNSSYVPDGFFNEAPVAIVFYAFALPAILFLTLTSDERKLIVAALKSFIAQKTA